jgi:hypothetical protein
VKAGVQGSTSRPLVFNIFINDICDYISNSKYLLFADDLKIYCNINHVHDYQLLHPDNNYVQNWCFENGMTLNVGKYCSFTRKTVGFNFNYKRSYNPILRSQCVKDLGVLLD